ncbi:alpha/beta hydrolase [Paenibacillus assamensis]|uniref:alpha/beta hydrolase n=1 Tax=Paenibacillus assamensis TaxID=311244 RepID=UPI00040EB6B8|nr:thioesterase domain-containing protein [Paenibacillus assamensis]
MSGNLCNFNDSYIWIHGWGANEQLWQHAAQSLPDAAHHYVSFMECDSSDEMVAVIMERLAAATASSQRCHLVGWSMGGMLAIEAVAKWLRGTGRTVRSLGSIGNNDAGQEVRSRSDMRQREAGSAAHSVDDGRLSEVASNTRCGQSLDLREARSDMRSRGNVKLREAVSNSSAMSGEEMKLRQPNAGLLASLVLVGSTLRFVAPTSTEGWPPRVLQRMRQRLAAAPEQTLREFAERLLAPAERQQHRPLEAKLIERFQRPGFTPAGLDAGLAYLASANLTDAWAQLCAAQLPVLWLHGEQDPLVSIGAQAEARRLAGPDVRSVVYRRLTGQGHIPFLTHPREWEEEVSRWHEQFQS